jgi:hypothetical protein
MICHKHKCIFIHIPRTAGTSIEQSIKPDWRFGNFKDEKHVLASTAKHLYKDYWNDYFKFSFVRNPWSRMLSMSQYKNFYGCIIKGGKIDVSKYIQQYSSIEVDPRSKGNIENIKPIKNAVYLNILNEELNFIGRFENLQEDYGKVCAIINCKNKLLHKEARKEKNKHYTEYYDDETKQIVAERYAKDIEHFGYEFGG